MEIKTIEQTQADCRHLVTVCNRPNGVGNFIGQHILCDFSLGRHEWKKDSLSLNCLLQRDVYTSV